LQNVKQAPTFQRGIESSYGTVIENVPYEPRPINVKFDVDMEPYSIFTVKHTSADAYYIGNATVTAVKVDHPVEKQKDAFIYCTNGDIKVKATNSLDCFIIGFEKPFEVLYTGTAPTVGERLRVTTTAPLYQVQKHSAGQLLAVSQPNTSTFRIWVIRCWKKDEIYGTLAEAITYGATSNKPLNIWRNGAITSPVETETVYFNWLGATGQVLPAGVKVEAKFWEDLGYYRISNSNCT
jgi:hypothetical protein